MTTTFSPGPWAQDYFTQLDGHKCHGVKSPSCGVAVAWMHGRNSDETEANARLVAASPTMLSVLQELEESAGYWSEYDVPLGIVDRIRKVIKQATGENS